MNRQQRRQEEWIDFHIRKHKEWMLKTTEPLPTWLIIRTVNFEKGDGKKALTIPCLIGKTEDNQSPNKVAKQLIDKYDPDVWVMFAEGWAKIIGEDFEEFEKTRKRGDIEKLPDKLEGLNIIAKNRDNTIEISEQYWLIRNDKGKLIDFKPTAVGTESYVKTSYLNENPKNRVNARLEVKEK